MQKRGILVFPTKKGEKSSFFVDFDLQIWDFFNPQSFDADVQEQFSASETEGKEQMVNC